MGLNSMRIGKIDHRLNQIETPNPQRGSLAMHAPWRTCKVRKQAVSFVVIGCPYGVLGETSTKARFSIAKGQVLS